MVKQSPENNSLEKRIENMSAIIVLHEYVQIGPGHDLRNFLVDNKIKNLLFITHPLLYVKESYKRSSHYKYYRNGQLVNERDARHWRLPEQLLYIKDFLYTFYWAFSKKMHYELFVGLDPLNAFSGIILKRVGLIEKSVYYSIDYFPQRFKNPLMNRIYHLFDKFAVRFSDETWNVGARMFEARKEYGHMRSKAYQRQFSVPIGVWLSKAKREKTFDKHQMVYAGHVVDYMGLDLVIRSLPEILKQIPTASLRIIGEGPVKKDLEKLVMKAGLADHVKFQGWEENREKFMAKLSESAVGIAAFNTNILDDKVKNADPAKLKDYMAAGLPIIVTKAIYDYQRIEKNSVGIVIDYKQEQFINAVLKLLQNLSLLKKYKENALQYVSQYDWGVIFTAALSRLLK